MIDEEKTYAEKGYYSTDLSFGSGKPVWAICEGKNCEREGGRGRWLKFRDYSALCYLCSLKERSMLKDGNKNAKLYYIDDDITYDEKGYRSTDLKSGSSKHVWAVCQGENCERKGGRGRWVKFQDRRELCHSCANKEKHISKEVNVTEKLPWVDDDITYAEKGYRSTDLKPNSRNLVYAICANPECEREGGRGRWVTLRSCRELCYSCAHKTEEFRKKKSEENTGRVFSEETIMLMSKSAKKRLEIPENNPNWKGGISFGEYCPKFNKQIKQDVRDKYNNCDYISGLPDNICNSCVKLDVHHVDYNKEQGCDEHEWRLIPLSKSNHTKTNFNRSFWNRLFTYALQYDETYYSGEDIDMWCTVK